MKKQFFVEGDADAKFLHDLIFYWYGVNTSRKTRQPKLRYPYHRRQRESFKTMGNYTTK